MSGAKESGAISQNEGYRIEWTFEESFSFSRLAKNLGRYHSPPFSVFGSKWCLKFVLESVSHTINFLIGVYLFGIDDPTLPKNVTLSFGVKNVDGKEKVLRSAVTHLFDKKDAGFEIDESLQLCYLEPGFVTVTCTMSMKDDVDYTLRLIELSDEFKKMLISKKNSDVTLKVQGYEFPVHKFVLASRSAVFETMFQADMKERNTGVVDIDDCHLGAFKNFLDFIYCGQFENSGDVIELYKIADKYCVDNLKSPCANFISNNLSVDNVFDAFLLGHHCDEPELKSVCNHFILNNLSVDNLLDAFLLGHRCDEPELKNESKKFFKEHFAEVVLTDKWGFFLKDDPILGNELLLYLASCMKIKENENK